MKMKSPNNTNLNSY